MDDANDGPHAREPQVEDITRICRALNAEGAKYVLIGGFAVIFHGGARTTEDIDLLIDASSDNVAKVKRVSCSGRQPRNLDSHEGHRAPL